MERFIAYVEIPAENFSRCVNFYTHAFGFSLKMHDYGEEKMAPFPNNEGAISFAKDFKPSADGTLVSLHCGKDLDGVLERIEHEGGKIVRPKTKIESEGMGYFALFIDSEGNKVGLYGDQ